MCRLFRRKKRCEKKRFCSSLRRERRTYSVELDVTVNVTAINLDRGFRHATLIIHKGQTDVLNYINKIAHHWRHGWRRCWRRGCTHVSCAYHSGYGRVSYVGELNSCEGDPASHFSFGLGFFFNARASSVAAGAFTQDVDHRIIPNWGAAALMIKTVMSVKRCMIRAKWRLPAASSA